MSLRDYYAGIPLQAVQDEYVSPPDLGGRRANYPIVNCTQQYGLFNEVRTDWYGPGSQLYEAIGFPKFDGAVWSIQLTARPGYYMEPETLYAMGMSDDDEFPPLG